MLSANTALVAGSPSALIWRCAHVRENNPIISANCQAESTLKMLTCYLPYRNGTGHSTLEKGKKDSLAPPSANAEMAATLLLTELNSQVK
jgi:hypothetical protein